MAKTGIGPGGGGKKCSLCGTSGLPSDALKCTYCGKELSKKCGGCQTENDAADRHCKKCGLAFMAAGGNPPAAPVPPAPKSPWKVTVDCVPDHREWSDKYEFHVKVSKDGVAVTGHLMISGLEMGKGDTFTAPPVSGASLGVWLSSKATAPSVVAGQESFICGNPSLIKELGSAIGDAGLSKVAINGSGIIGVTVVTGGGRIVVFRLHEAELDKEIRFDLKGPRHRDPKSGSLSDLFSLRVKHNRGQ